MGNCLVRLALESPRAPSCAALEPAMTHRRRSIQAGVLGVLALGAVAQAQPAPGQLQSSVLAVDTPAQPAPRPVQSPDQGRDNVFLRFFRDGEWYGSRGERQEKRADTGD